MRMTFQLVYFKKEKKKKVSFDASALSCSTRHMLCLVAVLIVLISRAGRRNALSRAPLARQLRSWNRLQRQAPQSLPSRGKISPRAAGASRPCEAIVRRWRLHAVLLRRSRGSHNRNRRLTLDAYRAAGSRSEP